MVWLNSLPNLMAKAWLAFMVLIALGGALFRFDSTEHANRQFPSIAFLPPWSKATFLSVVSNAPRQPSAWWRGLLGGGYHDSVLFIPMADTSLQQRRIAVEVFTTSRASEQRFYTYLDVHFAVADSTIARYATTASNAFVFRDLNNKTHRVSNDSLRDLTSKSVRQFTFIFGTDAHGRSVLSRLTAGAFHTLTVAVCSSFIALALAILVGLLAGYFTHWPGELARAGMKLFWSIPAIMLAMLVTILLGKGIAALVIALGSVLWVEVAQLVSTEVRALRQKEFIRASRILGLSVWQTFKWHLVPNLRPLLGFYAISTMAEAVLLEAGFSFLGLGAQPPAPTWGGMVRDSYGYIITSHWWLPMMPAAAIFLLVLSLLTLERRREKI